MAGITYPPLNREQHLFGPGPKRILALDGGGVLGIVEIAFLEQIEAILRQQHGNDQLVLSDYFDLIGGTSTGSIIGTCLALGWPVAQVRDLYFDLGPRIFNRSLSRNGMFRSVFKATPLSNNLREHFAQRLLDSDDLKTGLALTMKRLDTGSPWLIINSRKWKYWEIAGTTRNNRDYLLWELVRASTAAPFYFKPKKFVIAENEHQPGQNTKTETIEGEFADGGITPHNNPALAMLMLARMQPYGLNWSVGRNELLMVSIGAGHRRLTSKDPATNLEGWMSGQLLRTYRSGLGLARDLNVEIVKIMQWLSEPQQPIRINGEVDTLNGTLLLPKTAPLNGEVLSFQRYDMPLPKEYDDFVNPDVMQPVYKLAKQAAQASGTGVELAHFPDVFRLDQQRAPLPEGIRVQVEAMRRQAEQAPMRSCVIGVVGHRPNRLPKVELPRIQKQIGTALAALSEGRDAASVVVMSGLAEGTDRIASHLALAGGLSIAALLPFKRDEYAKDFQGPDAMQGSLAEFDQLMAKAVSSTEVQAVDAIHDRNAGYAEQGTTLVQAADALIAVWDGQNAHGRGGTAEVIASAVVKGIPIFWIGTDPDAPMRRL